MIACLDVYMPVRILALLEQQIEVVQQLLGKSAPFSAISSSTGVLMTWFPMHPRAS